MLGDPELVSPSVSQEASSEKNTSPSSPPKPSSPRKPTQKKKPKSSRTSYTPSRQSERIISRMVKAKKGSSKEEEGEVFKISTSDNDSERSVPEKQNKKSTEESVSEEQVSSKREKKKKEKGKAKISEVSLFKDAETEKVFQSK